MGNQKKTTLRRQIKEDGLGFYLNFGPERLRPFRPKRTKFNLDGWVSMIPIKYFFPDGSRVFQDEDYYEIWKRTAQNR